MGDGRLMSEELAEIVFILGNMTFNPTKFIKGSIFGPLYWKKYPFLMDSEQKEMQKRFKNFKVMILEILEKRLDFF